MVGKARLAPTKSDRLLQQIHYVKQLHGLNRMRFLPQQTGSVGGSGSVAGDTSVDEGFLRTAGGTMIGPIAFFPAAVTIAAGIIDIGALTTNYSSRLIVALQTPPNDDLSRIDNATFAGQLLIVQSLLGENLTIKHLDPAVGGANIRTSTALDIVMTPQSDVWLIFDAVSNQWTNIGGTSGVGDNLGNHIATQDILPDADGTLDIGSTTLAFHDLFIDRIKFPNVSTTISTEYGIYVETGSNDLKINVPSTRRTVFEVNAVEQIAVEADGDLNFNNNSADAVAGIFFTLFGGFSHSISALSDRLQFIAPSGDFFEFNALIQPNADGTVDLGTTALAFQDFFIERIKFPNVATTISTEFGIYVETGSNELKINVPSTRRIAFEVNGVEGIGVDTDGDLDFNNNNADALGGIIWTFGHIIQPLSGKLVFTNAGADFFEFNNALLPNAAGAVDLGSTSFAFDDLWIGKVRFADGSADPSASTGSRISSDAGGNMDFNVNLTSNTYTFWFNGVQRGFILESGGLGKLDFPIVEVDSHIQFQNSAVDPAVNGNMRMNGTDVKVFSGGTLINFSALPSLGGANTWTGVNIFTNLINLNADVTLGDSNADNIAVLGNISTFMQVEEITIPTAPDANTLRVYAKDKAGITEYFYKNSAGTERDMSLAGGSGDDLGNHTATQDLDMNGKNIDNVSSTVSVAVAGAIRFPQAAKISWLNNAGTVDLFLNTDSSDQLVWSGPIFNIAELAGGNSELWMNGASVIKHIQSSGDVQFNTGVTDKFEFFDNTYANLILTIKRTGTGIVIPAGTTLTVDSNTISINSLNIDIGNATTDKIGFWNTPGVTQPSHIADPTGGATVDSQARTAIIAINAMLASTGFTAAS